MRADSEHRSDRARRARSPSPVARRSPVPLARAPRPAVVVPTRLQLYDVRRIDFNALFGLRSSLLLLPTVVRQRRRGGGFDVAAAGGVRDVLERKGHPHELVIIPLAAHRLDVDRLAVVVVSGGGGGR